VTNGIPYIIVVSVLIHIYSTFDATWNLRWKSVILSSLNNGWVCRWYSWIQVGKEKHIVVTCIRFYPLKTLSRVQRRSIPKGVCSSTFNKQS